MLQNRSRIRTVMLGGILGLVTGAIASVVFVRVGLAIFLDWRAFISDAPTHIFIAFLGSIVGLIVGLFSACTVTSDSTGREAVAPLWLIIFLEGLGGSAGGAFLLVMIVWGLRIHERESMELGDFVIGALHGAFIGACVTVFVRRLLQRSSPIG
jgi:hypothetical protein